MIKKDGVEVKINNPNDANALGIGMVHQHFKLVECFSVLDNIILGDEDTKHGILQRARTPGKRSWRCRRNTACGSTPTP